MSPFDALSVCAEVAIAILGFSGIVAVFGERHYERVGQPLFRTLFRGTLTPLGVIALAFILEGANLEEATTWRICSAAHAVAQSFIIYISVRQAGRTMAPVSFPLRTMMIGGLSILGLSVLNVVALHAFWPVLVVICWALGVSLFAFAGLIFSSRTA
jgi:hypothetical protein